MSSSVERLRHLPSKDAIAPNGSREINNNIIQESAASSGGFPYTAPPVDLSFRSLSSFSGKYPVSDEEPRTHPKKALHKTSGGRYRSTSLKLNNNLLESWSGLGQFVGSIMDNPGALYWLDLSFNFLYKIGREILEFPQLKILYLHGNTIEDISEVDKLSGMGNLQRLTLHGNVIAEEDDYRMYVLKKLPFLKVLDFSRVTGAEINCAKHLTLKKKPKRTAKRKRMRGADLAD